MTKTLVIIAILASLVALAVICGGAVLGATGQDNASAPTIVTETTTKAAPKTSVRPDTIREGTWEVGTDIKPGKYKTKGALKSVIIYCSWLVQDGVTFIDGGGVDNVDAQGVVTLKMGQTFETNGCQDWYLAK